ncbi:hypothetical protein ACIHEJ_10435 [Streptomyces sp. NPDC052301]|uniref:hypothetical protein n=1 Tax=Streptomyces sp. NPDC052301 TaxID=3365687 RepID=UPI0037CE8196
MRRTARALSVALVAGAALALTGTGAVAAPAADTPPVACDTVPGPALAPLDDESAALEDGTVQPSPAAGTAGRAAGPPYRGTVRTAAGRPATGPSDTGPSDTGPDSVPTADGTCPPAPGAAREQTGAPYTPTHGDDDADGACTAGKQCDDDTHQGGDTGAACGEGRQPCQDGGAQCRDGQACPERSPCKAGAQCSGDDGHQGCTKPESCTDDDHGCAASDAAPCPDEHTCGAPHDTDGCAPAGVEHGVQAGQGGSYDPSIPALVAGGVLITIACAAAGYRLYGRRRSSDRRTTDL